MKPAVQGRTPAHVVSVNVGRTRTVTLDGRPVRTAIWKSPVIGKIRLRGVNLDGDDQADRSVHGGPDKAVYAYSAEDLAWWTSELQRGIGPGPGVLRPGRRPADRDRR